MTTEAQDEQLEKAKSIVLKVIEDLNAALAWSESNVSVLTYELEEARKENKELKFRLEGLEK